MAMKLAPHIFETREYLAEGMDRLARRHREGETGRAICRAMSDLREREVCRLFEIAAADHCVSVDDSIAFVAHGGTGCRTVAPYSDFDLMIVLPSADAARLRPIADRLVRDIFDIGLSLGHMVVTPREAARLACEEPTNCTSFMQMRLVAGDARLFEDLKKRVFRAVLAKQRQLVAGIQRERNRERLRFGETVHLLEPNIKKSRGGIRDIQMIGWLGRLRYEVESFSELARRGILTSDDVRALDEAEEFLLRLRNEMHFRAGRSEDRLDRMTQRELAECRRYDGEGGAMLPVEQFMRDYFRHTDRVDYLAEAVTHMAVSSPRVSRLATAVFGRRVEGGVMIGPMGLRMSIAGLKMLTGSLSEMMRLVGLSNLYDKRIDPETYAVLRREASRLPKNAAPSPEARRRFLSLLEHPARLGGCLRDLHRTELLERFIPAMGRTRGLLQYNQYHKYTVDEHCLRTVEFIASLSSDDSDTPPASAYRQIDRKWILHLAALLHDQGKGLGGDHQEQGRRIARETAEMFGLSADDSDTLQRLVKGHSMMTHAAFRRDTTDPNLAIDLAAQLGSPEMLRMLYVLTAADLSAVGPNVWDDWKAYILGDLYHRILCNLTGGMMDECSESACRVRQAISDRLDRSGGDSRPWLRQLIESLPDSYLKTTDLKRVAGELSFLDKMESRGAVARAEFDTATQTVSITVGTWKNMVDGIFHRLCGTLSGLGLQIRSAEIATLAGGVALDRFCVVDEDYTGRSTDARLREIESSLVAALVDPDSNIARVRRRRTRSENRAITSPRTTVRIDNSVSDEFSVIDVFAADRPGLLHDLARALYEEGLSVGRAKIDTYPDLIVDVFYVTDREGEKVIDATRLAGIRRRLLEVLDDSEVAGFITGGD